VKIDKSFIDNLDTDPAAAVLVKGILDAAHALGLSVTAEGVERRPQLELLRGLGCDAAQGYLIARPTSPADLA
jgi:EAL domain-containing protein (putative c-di-GMP-specific phosphodiesterase class I)